VDDATAQAYWSPLIADGSVITTIPGPYDVGTLYVVPCTTKLPSLTIIFGDVASAYGNATISGEALQQTSWPRGDGCKFLYSRQSLFSRASKLNADLVANAVSLF
jgi:hypothetical protein